MRKLPLIIVALLAFLSNNFGQQTTILFDHGKYGFDYSNIKDIKWKADRSFEILIKQVEDIELLKNISIEVNREGGEVLEDAIAIRKSQGVIDSFPQDSFKLQPFDAVMAEYICRFPHLEVGDTIAVSYSIKSEPKTDIIRWEIQQAYPVLNSTFEFILPEIALYTDHITNGEFLESEKLLDTTYIIDRSHIPSKGVKMTFKDIPPFVEEPFAPDLNETRPAVLLSINDLLLGDVQLYMPTWLDQVSDLVVGDYFGRQFRIRASYRWLSDKALEILNTKYTDELMLLKLYEFVHAEFQWDGSYGLFPSHTLQDMQEFKNVNKASINMALLALLQEAGFKAHPVLVTTTDQPFVYKEIPNINQFNHFVIAVEQGKELIYLDAGDPLLPPGLVDSGVRHTNAILIRNYKGSWHEIPDFQSKSIMLVDMKVDQDLSASGMIMASFEGYDAHNERHFLNGDPRGLYWKERAAAISPDIRVDSVRYENVRNLLEPFVNKVFFHIAPSQDQEEMAFLPVFYSFFNQQYFTDSVRRNRILFPAKLVEQVIFNIAFDDEFQIESIPEDLKLRMIDSSSEMVFRKTSDETKAQCTFRITLDKKIIEPVYYDALKEYLAQLAAALRQPVVIAKR